MTKQAFTHINGNLFACAANNPTRYIDPTGEFNWETNTVEPNDCLSKIAADRWRNLHLAGEENESNNFRHVAIIAFSARL